MRYKGACEDVFFLTINDKISGLIGCMNGLSEKSGYSISDMGVYIQPIVQGTGVHVEFNLFYDAKNSSEANRIKALTREATKSLMAQGAFFSRPYGQNTGLVLNRDAATMNVLTKLKKMFDPNFIMNPGKVGF